MRRAVEEEAAIMNQLKVQNVSLGFVKITTILYFELFWVFFIVNFTCVAIRNP